MQILTDPEEQASLLDLLARSGYLLCKDQSGIGCTWTVSSDFPKDGYCHANGMRYWAVDVSGMLPIYRELYWYIFAKRLDHWGAGESDRVGLLYVDGLILYWGPDRWMRANQPAQIAREKLEHGDANWFLQLEETWHAAAVRLENALGRLWTMLCNEKVSVQALSTVLEGKIFLNALGIDALMLSSEALEALLAPWLGEAAKVVAEACLLPHSGYVAYDVLEAECWQLAAAHDPPQDLPREARHRFIRHGLFYHYEALNTDRKPYFFCQFPLEVAARYRSAVAAPLGYSQQHSDVQARQWRRRYHRQWACQMIEQHVADSASRQRLQLMVRFLGGARDFDEEKRRLNMKLWRAVFAIADGLAISLTQPASTADALYRRIELAHGQIQIDPILLPV